nr:ABC transporter permease [Streptococcus sp. 11-4097]
YAICVSGLSMLIAAFIREEKMADVMGGIGIQILAILGGSMLPIYVFPDTLQTIANVAPNKWALTSFLNIMSGTSWDVLLPVIF